MSCKNAVESGQQSSLQKLGPVRSQILRRDRQGPITKIITTLDLLPNLPSFIRRVCSGYALVWGVLRTQSV